MENLTIQEMAKYINDNHSTLIINLYERWQSEKEYENFNDYVERFKKAVPTTTRGKKRPFAFIVKCSNGFVQVAVKVKGNYIQIFYTKVEK